jgi:hypothetical protein
VKTLRTRRWLPSSLSISATPVVNLDVALARKSGCPLTHVTSEVDEQPLARGVHLAQRWLQPTSPLAIQIAEPGVAKAIGRRRAVFRPQQRKRHVRPPEFPVNRGPVRHRALVAPHIRRRREQQRLKACIVQPIRQRPAQTRAARPPQVVAPLLGSVAGFGRWPVAADGAPIATAESRVSYASTISRQASRALAPPQRIDTTLG